MSTADPSSTTGEGTDISQLQREVRELRETMGEIKSALNIHKAMDSEPTQPVDYQTTSEDGHNMHKSVNTGPPPTTTTSGSEAGPTIRDVTETGKEANDVTPSQGIPAHPWTAVGNTANMDMGNGGNLLPPSALQGTLSAAAGNALGTILPNPWIRALPGSTAAFPGANPGTSMVTGPAAQPTGATHFRENGGHLQLQPSAGVSGFGAGGPTFAPKLAPQQALQTQGVASGDLPYIDIVSPQLRQDIVQGKDVNLASLLIRGYTSEYERSQRYVVTADDAIPLKPMKDNRLSRPLSIQDFIKAFTMYKNVMCEAYPIRRWELDMYLKTIVDFSTDFGGIMFYEYHKDFSARAATMLLDYGIKIDWSKRDYDLFSKHFAGCRAHACSLCGSVTHKVAFCPMSADGSSSGSNTNNNNKKTRNQNTNSNSTFASNDIAGRVRSYVDGKEICNNYNSNKGCGRGT